MMSLYSGQWEVSSSIIPSQLVFHRGCGKIDMPNISVRVYTSAFSFHLINIPNEVLPSFLSLLRIACHNAFLQYVDLQWHCYFAM